MKRLIVLLLSAAGLTFGIACTASAANAPAAPTPWSCGGAVCMRVMPTVSVQPFNSHGCNGDVCITVTGNATTGYSTVGQGSGFFGHVQVFGPDLQTTGAEANNPVASGNGIGAGQTCAVAWMAVTGGGHTQVGKACESVS